MTASHEALQSMLAQLDTLQVQAGNRAATVRAARRLNRGSALVAASATTRPASRLRSTPTPRRGHGHYD